MPFVAQTNLQLYNQLRREARSDDDMRLVRAAYELAVTHYSGYFGGDRKPFVAHTIGVASILASLGQPALMIAAGLLHNVYGNGDFGDGLHNAATARRRRLVRTAVGGAVEDVLYRFHTCRVRLDPDEGYRQRLARLAQLDNEVLLLDLADVVEKHVDSSVLYHGNGSWISDPIGRHGPPRRRPATIWANADKCQRRRPSGRKTGAACPRRARFPARHPRAARTGRARRRACA